MSNKNMDMCSGPLLGKIIRFAIPVMLTGILQLFYNAMDVIVVGRYAGAASLAAVGSTGALINLVVNVFMGLSVGVNVAVANYIGAKKYNDVSQTVHTSTALSLICGVAVGAAGFLCAKLFLEIMNTPEDVIDLAALYVKIYFIGTPANLLYNFCAGVLRAKGDTQRPLYILGLSGIVNVVLNLVFVIRFKLDVAGVAIATIVSQYISAVLVTVYLMRTDDCTKLYLRKIKIYKDKLAVIVRVGIPSGIQGSVFSLSNTVIQSSVNSFGSVVMAGNAAGANIEGFVYILMNSLHHAAVSFAGQNKGAKKFDRIGKTTRICIITTTVIGIASSVLVLLNSHFLLNIYMPGAEEAISYGALRLMYICIPYFLCGMMDVMSGALRGMGNSFLPMIISMIGACGLRIVWIYTVFAAYHTLPVLFVSYPISWAVTLAALVIAYFAVKKKIVKEAA